MNFKSKLRVTKPLAKIISLVSIIMLISVFQGCEKEDIYSVEEIVYSSEKKGFYLYDNANFPLTIREQLTNSEFELLCNLSKEYGVYLLDPDEYISSEFKKLESPIETQKWLDVKLTYAEPTIELDRKLNSLDINTPRLKSGCGEGYEETGAKAISIPIAYITMGAGWTTGVVNLNWAYFYDADLREASNIQDVNISVSDDGYGAVCAFSGTKAVYILDNNFEFTYVVEGTVWLGASLGGIAIGIPTIDISKSGNYLCPY